MDKATVKIVKLEPMRVASFYAFGNTPEAEAWAKTKEWAMARGLWDDRSAHPIFGFSNPCTPNARGRYGYEVWLKIDGEVEPTAEMRVEEFPGGTYATVHCDTHGDPAKEIPGTWQALAEWARETNTRFGFHQELEGFVTDGDDAEHLVLDLYLPIVT